MKFWYDTEFLEDGKTIELISIGIVAEDGREYYAVRSDAPWARIEKHSWLTANVVPHLPKDLHDPAYRNKVHLASEVHRFLTQHNGPVELWGYFSAYDHVVLAQLWGTMMQIPRGIPMWTNDVQQVAAALGLDNSLPAHTGTVHNALDDARWTREAWKYVTSYLKENDADPAHRCDEGSVEQPGRGAA